MDKLPSPSHQRKKTWLDKLVMWVVVIIAGVVVLLSFHNTASLAEELKLNPYLTAGLVEILFAVLLGIRARQRATQRNVPLFIHIGFYASFIFVTGVNMYGLSKQNPIVGSIVGLAISGSMWLMENTLVWLWTESHLPYKKTARELKKEAKREIKEMKIRQRIKWMLWEAQKPDLKLIQKARKAEEEREMVVAEGLPEYFRNELGELVEEKRNAHSEKITQELVTQNKVITQTQITQDEVIQQDKVAQDNNTQNEQVAHNEFTQDQETAQTTKQMNFAHNELFAQKGDYFTQERVITQTPKMNTVESLYKADKLKEERVKTETAQEHITQQITQNEEVTQECITPTTQEVTQENFAQNETITQQTAQKHITQEDITQNKVTQNEITQSEITHEQIAQGKVIFLKDKIAQTKIADKLKKFRKKDAIAHAIQCALDYEQQHGDRPTKRELMKLAKCTDHQAKEALKIIREVVEEMDQTG